MIHDAIPGLVLVLTLAGGMVLAQLYYPPRTKTRWRTRLRWVFYVGSLAVTGLVALRVFEIYRSVGL